MTPLVAAFSRPVENAAGWWPTGTVNRRVACRPSLSAAGSGADPAGRYHISAEHTGRAKGIAVKSWVRNCCGVTPNG